MIIIITLLTSYFGGLLGVIIAEHDLRLVRFAISSLRNILSIFSSISSAHCVE